MIWRALCFSHIGFYIVRAVIFTSNIPPKTLLSAASTSDLQWSVCSLSVETRGVTLGYTHREESGQCALCLLLSEIVWPCPPPVIQKKSRPLYPHKDRPSEKICHGLLQRHVHTHPSKIGIHLTDFWLSVSGVTAVVYCTDIVYIVTDIKQRLDTLSLI